MEKISPRITVLLEKLIVAQLIVAQLIVAQLIVAQLIVAQLIKKFAAVYETRTFTTAVRIPQIWAQFQIR